MNVSVESSPINQSHRFIQCHWLLSKSNDVWRKEGQAMRYHGVGQNYDKKKTVFYLILIICFSLVILGWMISDQCTSGKYFSGAEWTHCSSTTSSNMSLYHPTQDERPEVQYKISFVRVRKRYISCVLNSSHEIVIFVPFLWFNKVSFTFEELNWVSCDVFPEETRLSI